MGEGEPALGKDPLEEEELGDVKWMDFGDGEGESRERLEGML